MTQPPVRVVKILRGGELQSPPAGSAVARSAAPAPSPAPLPPGESIYGVPASAVQHCCGRGCKHCRIYWHRAGR